MTAAQGEIRKRSRLTGRDQQILTLLGEYGCVTAERIKRHFWNSTPASCIHYRRLSILKRRGLIENVQGDRAMTIGYRLTKRGQVALRKIQQPGGALVNRRAYKTQFEHDQLLIDVRRIMKKSPIVREFKTESEIRRNLIDGAARLRHWENAPIIPDAMFLFEVPGHKMRIAIELELTIKAKRRYASIFRNHLLSKDWSLVIYIVKNVAFRDQLMQTLDHIKTTDLEVRIAKTVNGIYFCALDEFLSRELSAPMTNGKKEISLTQIAQNFGLKA